MQIFLSWSGGRSRAVAKALESWVGKVIQAAEPWISSDIEKGMRWAPEIADRLERSKVGVICLTKDNLDSKWIHFEAGALSKTKGAQVCTFLLDVKPTDVEHPLAQFQHTVFLKADVLKLIQTINLAVQKSDERFLTEPDLLENFETFWPRLEVLLKEAIALPSSEGLPRRSDSDKLEEILELLRRQERTRSVERRLFDLLADNTSNIETVHYGDKDNSSSIVSHRISKNQLAALLLASRDKGTHVNDNSVILNKQDFEEHFR